jgi:hypothetical protein
MLHRRRTARRVFATLATGMACAAGWVLACTGGGAAPPRTDPGPRIAAALATVSDADFNGLGRSIWIGTAAGAALFEESADVPRPAASSIKTSYLVEFFSHRAEALDEPVPGAAAIVGDPEHPAIVHFDAETQAEINEHLATADARTVGRHMIRGTGVSNPVYNAAANLVTAFLGGPPELTARIQARHPDFAGLDSRRYMLAARDVTGDNTATAGSLAAVLAAIARGDVPSVSSETHDALRDILFLEDTDDGRHFYKGGSLNSNPITRVLSGYYEVPGEPAGRALVYAFMAEIPGPESIAADDPEPGDAGRRLQDHLEALRAAALPVARAWLSGREPPE